VLAEPEPIQEHHQPAPVVQAAGQQLGQPLRGGRHEPARHRRLRRARGLLGNARADWLQPRLVAAGRQPRQHPGDDPLGQQVGTGERGVGLQRNLVLARAHRPDPRTADGKPPPAQGHHARLAAVPLGPPGRVMAALRAGQLGDLGGHELGHDLQADRGRGRQQPLGHVRGKDRQVLIDPAGQPLGQPSGRAGAPASAGQGRRRAVIAGAGVGVLHRGPPWRLGRLRKRVTSRAPGRTPPQIPRAPGQPPTACSNARHRHHRSASDRSPVTTTTWPAEMSHPGRRAGSWRTVDQPLGDAGEPGSPSRNAWRSAKVVTSGATSWTTAARLSHSPRGWPCTKGRPNRQTQLALRLDHHFRADPIRRSDLRIRGSSTTRGGGASSRRSARQPSPLRGPPRG
jgi:hypothetical protein